VQALQTAARIKRPHDGQRRFSCRAVSRPRPIAIRIIAAPTPVVRTLSSARCGVSAFMPVFF